MQNKLTLKKQKKLTILRAKGIKTLLIMKEACMTIYIKLILWIMK